jgi:hypothetical protein
LLSAKNYEPHPEPFEFSIVDFNWERVVSLSKKKKLFKKKKKEKTILSLFL